MNRVKKGIFTIFSGNELRTTRFKRTNSTGISIPNRRNFTFPFFSVGINFPREFILEFFGYVGLEEFSSRITNSSPKNPPLSLVLQWVFIGSFGPFWGKIGGVKGKTSWNLNFKIGIGWARICTKFRRCCSRFFTTVCCIVCC